MRNIPRLFPAVWAALALALSSSAGAQDKPGPGHGGVAIEATSKAEMFKIEHDSSPIPRDFLDQPPLIPHPTEGFQITRNFNICMQCHSWSRYRETGAVKVSRMLLAPVRAATRLVVCCGGMVSPTTKVWSPKF